MAPPADDDTRLARFRRGAPGVDARPGVSVGPPPVVPQFRGDAPRDAAAGDQAVPSDPALPPFAPPVQPPAGWAPPPAAPTSDHLFAEFSPERSPAPGTAAGPGTVAQPANEPLYGAPSYEWMPVEEDPGRPTGIASIAVGIFVGIVGLFIGVHSIRRSRAVGLSGVVGIVGVIVSSLSILLFGSIVLSWVRYEVEVAQQCALVGPGQYYTSSGDLVRCD